MSYPSPLDVGRGLARGLSRLIKHGNNGAVGTLYEPVTSNGNLMIPPPSGAQRLLATSTSAADNPAGIGAHTIRITGLDAQARVIVEDITLSGTTPSALTQQLFWRINFADVIESGTYGTASTGSHQGTITVSDQAAEIWAQIRINGFPHSRWQSSWYTVPDGTTAYVNGYRIGVESNKQANIKLLARIDGLNEVPPFAPISELSESTGVSGGRDVDLPYVFGPLRAGTDIGAIAQMESTTGRVSVDIDFVLEART